MYFAAKNGFLRTDKRCCDLPYCCNNNAYNTAPGTERAHESSTACVSDDKPFNTTNPGYRSPECHTDRSRLFCLCLERNDCCQTISFRRKQTPSAIVTRHTRTSCTPLTAASSFSAHLSSPLSENSLVKAQKNKKATAAALSTEALAIRNTAPSPEACFLFYAKQTRAHTTAAHSIAHQVFLFREKN